MCFIVKHGYKTVHFFEIGRVMLQVILQQSIMVMLCFLVHFCTQIAQNGKFQVEVNITASLQQHVEEYSRTLLIETPKGFSEVPRM